MVSLTEKMIGPGYETLVKQFKVSQLQEIRRECEALHKDVTVSPLFPRRVVSLGPLLTFYRT